MIYIKFQRIFVLLEILLYLKFVDNGGMKLVDSFFVYSVVRATEKCKGDKHELKAEIKYWAKEKNGKKTLSDRK